MTTIVKSKCKISRRIGGRSLWGHPDKVIAKKKYPPGQHGRSISRGRKSEFSKQFRAQKTALAYYHLRLNQMKNIHKLAFSKKGDKINNFVGMLESLLPMFLFRSKIASTIYFARQLVSHGHVFVNGKPVNINYYFLSNGDVITIDDKMKKSPIILNSISELWRDTPEYIVLDPEKMEAKFVSKPIHDEIPYAIDMQINLVAESL